MGAASPESLTRDVRSLLNKRVELVLDDVVRLDPTAGKLWLGREGTMSYDYAVLATGTRLDRSAIPGLEEIKTAVTRPAFDMAAAVRREQSRRAVWRRIEVPNRFTSEEAPKLAMAAAAGPSGATQLAGFGISPGLVEGRARVLRSPEEGERLEVGEILVAPATDPAWSPLFAVASGIIVEIGAFYGRVTRTLARNAGPQVRIFAFQSRRPFFEHAGKSIYGEGDAASLERYDFNLLADNTSDLEPVTVLLERSPPPFAWPGPWAPDLVLLDISSRIEIITENALYWVRSLAPSGKFVVVSPKFLRRDGGIESGSRPGGDSDGRRFAGPSGGDSRTGRGMARRWAGGSGPAAQSGRARIAPLVVRGVL